MRTLMASLVAIALVAAACAQPVSDDSVVNEDLQPAVSTSVQATPPTTTSPVTPSSVAPAEVTTVPSTTAPATTTTETPQPSADETVTTLTTQPPKETIVKPIQPVEPHAEGPVAAAVADLAARLGVGESVITVVSVEEVTWPDGSLGCPQPGMRYTQVLVNGSLILLEVDGVTYEYHSGGGRDPFYCPNPTEPVSDDYGDG